MSEELKPEDGMDNVEKLFPGDERLATLLDAILEIIWERGQGLPFPAVLGVLELVKDNIKSTQAEDICGKHD